MKDCFYKIVRFLSPILAFILFSIELYAQDGVVIINEFNYEAGCDQYIELKNLGPGRQNIGCFKLVNEKYAITIPPNTYLDPGKMFLIAGISSITCGATTNKTVDLNWTNCTNCTSTSLTQNQFFNDWASNASYPLALLNNNNTVVDAMRTYPNKALATLQAPTTTTSTSSGTGCTTSTINLPTDINPATTLYESINPASGNNGTFSRSGDGSCTWFKATAAKRTPGLNNEVESGTGTVGATADFGLNCTSGSTYSSTLTVNVSSTPYWYSYVFSPNENLSGGTSPVSSSNNTSPTIVINNPQIGYHSFLFAPTADATCGQISLITRIINPILSIDSTFGLPCTGGTATFDLKNPDPSYFSMTYTRTYSIDSDLSTTNGSPVTGTVTSSSTNPDITFSNLTKGFYRIELDPAYGCNKILDFEVKDPVLSVSKSYSLECTGGTATFEVNNSSPETYFPLTYTRMYSATSSTVATVDQTVGPFTISSHTSTPDISFSNLAAGYYKLVLDPANGCNDTTIFQVLEPVPNITTTYSLQCSGGTASFELTSTPLENYFPFTYTRTFSVNSSTFSTIDGTVTGTVTTSTATPDIAFQNLMPGYYRMQIFPPNGCTRTIDFQVIDTLLRPVTPFTTTLYCAGGGGTSSTSLGSVRITFSNPPATFSNYLPIDYTYYNTASPTIAYTGTSTATSEVFIGGLQAGTYSLTLDPAVGCTTYDIPFTIGTCPTLTQTLKTFTGKNKGSKNDFTIELDTDGILDKIHLESSLDGRIFSEEADIPFENKKGLQKILFSSPASERIFFRLELHDIYNRLHQSAVIKILNTSGNIGIKSYPNPAGEYITLSNVATKDDMIVVKIISSTGRVYYEDRFTIKSGNNKLRVPTSKLPKGQYILSMHKVSTGERQSSNIIKY